MSVEIQQLRQRKFLPQNSSEYTNINCYVTYFPLELHRENSFVSELVRRWQAMHWHVVRIRIKGT